MATLTIRNVSGVLVERIKRLAGQKGISMEQEIRDMLQARYGQRREVLSRIQQRNENLPFESELALQDWKSQGRP